MQLQGSGGGEGDGSAIGSDGLDASGFVVEDSDGVDESLILGGFEGNVGETGDGSEVEFVLGTGFSKGMESASFIMIIIITAAITRSSGIMRNQ